MQNRYCRYDNSQRVSLFTREWIEIAFVLLQNGVTNKSPSLRGSGLKCTGQKSRFTAVIVSLFTREWIEIRWVVSVLRSCLCLPLYEGVD